MTTITTKTTVECVDRSDATKGDSKSNGKRSAGLIVSVLLNVMLGLGLVCMLVLHFRKKVGRHVAKYSVVTSPGQFQEDNDDDATEGMVIGEK